jgi:N-acetyl-anhydromuramyl-L-alanine amidase AmpD
MPQAQIEAGKWAVSDILSRYPGLTVCRHSDLNATACPGKNFPFAEITQEETEMRYNTIDEIPEWGKPTIQKLVTLGALKGTGDGFNISEDMLRMFVINDRMGLYA